MVGIILINDVHKFTYFFGKSTYYFKVRVLIIFLIFINLFGNLISQRIIKFFFPTDEQKGIVITILTCRDFNK